MKYREKQVVIEATQWFKNGDHPEDDVTRGGTTPNGQEYEGLVVRRYRSPNVPGDRLCADCGFALHAHGWIDETGRHDIVCPGDYVITLDDGGHVVFDRRVFECRYEPVPEAVVEMIDET